MSRLLLAGGGTAGHVNPLLAVAERLRAEKHEVFVLGTPVGLEATLVPEHGFMRLDISKLPFPRRLNGDALKFPFQFRSAVNIVVGYLAQYQIDAIVGFGGYVSSPAYQAGFRANVPVLIHEANAHPGLANRLGARRATAVGVAFVGTPLPRAVLVGMPLRYGIESFDRAALRPVAAKHFGLELNRPTLLVTGGSLGAKRINAVITESVQLFLNAGWQVLHFVGARNDVLKLPWSPGYVVRDYEPRMELAYALADFAVSRAGASTVAELTALGIPAVFVPYPVRNDHQRFNAQPFADAGGALIVSDADFSAEWVTTRLLPILSDWPSSDRFSAMKSAAARAGLRDGTARMCALIYGALRR